MRTAWRERPINVSLSRTEVPSGPGKRRMMSWSTDLVPKSARCSALASITHTTRPTIPWPVALSSSAASRTGCVFLGLDGWLAPTATFTLRASRVGVLTAPPASKFTGGRGDRFLTFISTAPPTTLYSGCFRARTWVSSFPCLTLESFPSPSRSWTRAHLGTLCSPPHRPA